MRDVVGFGSRVRFRACLLGGSMKARQKRHECPKCGKYYVDYPALSRKDNKTEICPERGMKEVMLQSLRFYKNR